MKYRQIFNSITDFAVIGMDQNGIVTDWNEGARHILGWTEEEVLGHPLHLIFTPEDVEAGRPETELRCALVEGYAKDERWHLRKSGERFWASGELTSLKDDSGGVSGFAKILTDRTEYREAQQKLESVNSTLEKIVSERTRERDRLWRNSLDLLLVIGPDGVLRSVNPAWTYVLGYAPEELVGKYFEPFVHPEDVSATVAAITTASQELLQHFEMRIRHKNGAYYWFAWRAVPEESLIYANGRDITMEKWQAEQLALTNEARLGLALESGSMGIWEWNIPADEITWLQGSKALHGVSDDEVILTMTAQEYAQRYVHPDDRNKVSETLTRAMTNGGKHRVEYRIIWPDGSAHWIEGRGQVYKDSVGKPSQMVGVTVDITRRRRIEHDLRFLAQASSELASLVDPHKTLDRLARLAVPEFADWCAIDLLQDDEKLERVSVAHIDPQKTKLTRDLLRRFPPDPNQPQGAWNVIRTGHPQLIHELSDDLLEKSVTNAEYRAVLKELGLRSYMGVPLSAHGKILGVVNFAAAESGRLYADEHLLLAADLAHRAAVALENAELYRNVRQSDHAKDVFLATLSHELRNPLAAIVGGLDILLLAGEDKQRFEQYIKLIQRQTKHLTRLVDDLMDVSRISTGKIKLKKEAASLAAILNSAIDTSRPEVEAGQHKLSITLPGESTNIVADPARLIQVFSNLITNAARYTPPGGNINVVLECSAEEYIVRVRDTGIGIEADRLKDIFKIFTQVEHPIYRPQGGLGIGLSLVEGLVSLHGGRVEALSEGVGKGSEFVVHLLRTLAMQDAATVTKSVKSLIPQADKSSRKVLVVDDNLDAATALADIISMIGHEATMVHDGLTAVTAAKETNPHLIFLDIGLPGIDGYEAARRIRKQEENKRPTVLVALTGWGQEQDKQRALQAGFDNHLERLTKWKREGIL
jgi:PAS domain S-box-containing protein